MMKKNHYGVFCDSFQRFYIYQTLLSKASYSAFRLYIFLSVHVFPGNQTHNLCAADAMLYHWATGTWYTINNSAVFNIIILFIYLFLHLCIWHKLLSKVNYIAFKHFVSSCIFWESNPWPWYCYHHVLYCLSTRKKNVNFHSCQDILLKLYILGEWWFSNVCYLCIF